MNKTILLFLSFFAISFSTFSQSTKQKPSVEKSFFGVQAGLFGIYAYNESKLSNNIALRTEAGMSMGIWGGTFYPKTGILFTPTLSVEPRYYYNLKRRVKKGKSIANNSANYFSLKTNYNPNLFVISNYDNISVNNHITIIPSYGFKRNLGKKLEYEFTAGYGYGYDFDLKDSAGVVNLGFRIGYRF